MPNKKTLEEHIEYLEQTVKLSLWVIAEWKESIHDKMYNIEWHLGFWGQFITSRQCFNYKSAQIFRNTSKIQHPMCRGQATIKDFKLFLGM